MNKINIGIDLSLRSAAVTVVDQNNKLVKIYIHQPKAVKGEPYEKLLISNIEKFKEIIIEITNEYEI